MPEELCQHRAGRCRCHGFIACEFILSVSVSGTLSLLRFSHLTTEHLPCAGQCAGAGAVEGTGAGGQVRGWMRGRLAPALQYFVYISLFRVAKRRQGLDGGDVVRRPPLLSLLSSRTLLLAKILSNRILVKRRGTGVKTTLLALQGVENYWRV